MGRLSARLICAVTLTPALAFSAPASAQLGGLLNTVKKKVEQEVERQVLDEPDGAVSTRAAGSEGSSRLRIEEGFNFSPGNTVLFQDDFSETPIGAMPRAWKTNGSGTVVSVDGLEGRWLSLQSFATYKLQQPPELPDSFTIEFDIVMAADSTRDVGGMPFGFTADNSVRSYVQDAHNDAGIAVANLGPRGGSKVSSSATDYYHSFDFDYRPYANRVMHVSIAVEGNMMQIYLDRTKIADAQLFRDNPAKYFFISAPINLNNGAKILFGNFRIAS